MPSFILVSVFYLPVQFSSVTQSCLTLCDLMDCGMPGFQSFTVSQSLLTFMFIELVMLSDHLILCHPLLLLPSIFPSVRDFSIEPALRIKWPKYLSFSFSISPSNEYSGFISFRMDWLDLLAVQGILRSQSKSINSSGLRFLHTSSLTSIHDSWKNHSFD